MRILLAKPVNQKMKIIIPSMSLGYLASILKQQNHDVAYLDCIKEGFDQTDIKEWMQKNGPFDVVGCTVFSGDVYSANSMFKTAKKIWPDCHAHSDNLLTLPLCLKSVPISLFLKIHLLLPPRCPG